MKPAREHFHHIFSSLWGGIIWKKYDLVKFEILVVLVNTFTADGKYPVWDYENLQFPN